MTSPVPQYLATLAASQAVVASTLSPGERAYLDQWDAEAVALLDGYGLDLGDVGQVHGRRRLPHPALTAHHYHLAANTFHTGHDQFGLGRNLLHHLGVVSIMEFIQNRFQVILLTHCLHLTVKGNR